MIELRPYKWQDAVEVIRAGAKQPTLTVTDMVRDFAKAKEARDGPAMTAVLDGLIIGCGGLEICWPGMAEAWIVARADLDRKALSAARLVKRKLLEWAKEYSLVRIQAPLRTDFDLGIRFAEWLGFQYEGTLRKYHPDQCDAFLYSWIGE